MPDPTPEPTPVGQYIPRELADNPELANVRALAKVLDSAFTVPGTNYKVGLDPILGLIPGVGDAVGMLIGGYIVTTAARNGVPRPVLARMLVNIGTDAVVGAVPLVGDVLDAAWRANAKNARLLEQAMTEPRSAARSSTWVLVGLAAAVLAIGVAGLALAILLAKLLYDAIW